MSRPLRLLIVEDSKDDALLLRRHLERSGYDLTDRRVDTARALREALQGSAGQPDSPDWDFVVADYSMPGFNGLEALKILQDTGLDIPFMTFQAIRCFRGVVPVYKTVCYKSAFIG